MKALDKWADRVYSESDFGRSIATSMAGAIGLSVYLLTNDWVIAGFSSIISFPIIRILSTGLHDKMMRNKTRKLEREEAKYTFEKLSDDEKGVVAAFITAGGSVMTWPQMNDLSLSGSCVESLIQREIIWTSMTADGMRETFALDAAIFDIGQEIYAGEMYINVMQKQQNNQ